MEHHFDIIVIGGGTAGVVAAIQAARAGGKTLLVEKNAIPGGTMTAAGIAFPGLFYAWKKQVIAGIGWELVSEAAAESGMPLPEFEKQNGMENHPAYQVRLNPLVYALCCEEKMSAAGVHILYHAMPAEITPFAGGAAVKLCTREGLAEFYAKRIIDCTGDASAVALAGFEVEHPFPCQPGTFNCRLSGYDPDALDWEALSAAADKAVAAGELCYTDLSWNNRTLTAQFIRSYGDNSNHIFPESSPHSAAGRSALEQSAHRSLLRAYRFLKRQPGMEHLRMELAAFECGVRESAVIKGEYTITGEDYVSGRKFPDALCNAFYPIDLHGEEGVEPLKLNEGSVPQVPLRALIPQKSDFLLAAGRCISSDRTANSALRVQATCMATAQAAAAAAVVSCQLNVPLSQTPAEKVREMLKQHGAILPDGI
ncbi:MAG: FAD-dependent oxidoreductase [Lentisphaeria bacterium]|nr:FAD-dependent oxidoreductase [Lentisphaeria bacterium]